MVLTLCMQIFFEAILETLLEPPCYLIDQGLCIALDFDFPIPVNGQTMMHDSFGSLFARSVCAGTKTTIMTS